MEQKIVLVHIKPRTYTKSYIEKKDETSDNSVCYQDVTFGLEDYLNEGWRIKQIMSNRFYINSHSLYAATSDIPGHCNISLTVLLEKE